MGEGEDSIWIVPGFFNVKHNNLKECMERMCSIKSF